MGELPRRVKVRVTHGRSVPFTLDGRPQRLRKGQVGVVPVQIYQRYSHKLEIVDAEDFDRYVAAVQTTDAVTRAVPTPVVVLPAEDAAVLDAEPEKLPEWPLQISPEEYLELYADKPNPSKTLQERLALARRLVDVSD